MSKNHISRHLRFCLINSAKTRTRAQKFALIPLDFGETQTGYLEMLVRRNSSNVAKVIVAKNKLHMERKT